MWPPPPPAGRRLVLVALVTALWVPAAAADAATCSVDGGRCTYHIRLAPACAPGAAAESETVHNVQNDYDEKVNEIERNLIDVRVNHQRRISELENRIHQLLQPLPSAPPPAPARGAPYADNAQRPENHLLNNLHGEFSHLRAEIARLKRKARTLEQNVFDANSKLRSMEKSLEKAKTELAEKTAAVDREREINRKLRKDLSEKDAELELLREQLNHTTHKLMATENSLDLEHKKNVKLRGHLAECKLDVEEKIQEIAWHETRYDKLHDLHINITVTLNKTMADLVECYRGKGNLFCGFEDPDLCGFSQDAVTDTFDWRWWSMRTPSSWTGPDTDHTCANHKGHYVYVEASRHSRGDRAKLVSPKYQGAEDMCMEFYYHMWGADTGTLNVYFMHWKMTLSELAKKEAEGQDLPPPVWRAFGNQGDVWTMARLQVPARIAFEGYKVVFEALMESGSAGDIALDDIRIFKGSCQGTQTLEQIRIIETNKVRDELEGTNEG